MTAGTLLADPPRVESPFAGTVEVDDADEPEPEPTDPETPELVRKASGRTVIAILLANFGLGYAQLMAPLVGLPVYVERFDPVGKAGSLGLTLGLSAVALLICTPIFGALSDHMTGRLGMRRPGLIGGTLVVCVGLLLEGLATSIWLLAGGVVVASIGQALFIGSYAAVIPDQISPARRGRVLGFQSLVYVLAGVSAAFIGAKLLDHQLLLFAAGGVLMLVTTGIAVVLLPDRVLEKSADHPRPSLLALLGEFRFSPKSVPNYSWVWLSRFIMTLGYTFGTFSIYFMTDELKVTDAQLPGLISLSVLVNLAGTVTGTILGGFLSDNLRRLPRLVIIVSVIFAVGGLLAATSFSIPVFMVALGVIAFATGAFLPIDGALVMAVLPGGRAETGKYMSIIAIAEQMPRAIGPLLVPGFIALSAALSVGGYRVLYIVLCVITVTGGIVVRNVKNIG